MPHHTLHSPSTGTSVTYSWSPGGGYDAVAFFEDGTRCQSVDEISDSRSLFATARWIVEVSELGNVDDLGDALGRLYLNETLDEIGSGPFGEIAQLVERLKELRR